MRSRSRPLPGVQTNTGAYCAKELERESASPSPRKRCARAASSSSNMSKRLSATDISALASMKNVAKCDTWCELQNPANHRVFERKLRPRPLGRGHACLGVTPKHAPNHPQRDSGCGIWSLVSQGTVDRRLGCRRTAPDTAHGGRPRFINAVHPTRSWHYGL